MTIVEYFQSFLTGIIGTIKFLINAVSALIGFFGKAPAVINFLSESLTMIPSIILPFCIVSIFLAVILLIIKVVL